MTLQLKKKDCIYLYIMEIGKLNKLRIERETEYGYFLEDQEGNEVLLPNAYVEDQMMLSDEIEVFIYRDSEDRVVATTLKPYIQLGEFAYLRIKEVNSYGAFADWGLPKDLMIPFAQQAERMKEGNSYLIFLLRDEQSDRLIGTSKVNKHIKRNDAELIPGDEVDLLLYNMTDLGMNAIVNNQYHGLIFHSHIHKNIHPGHKIKGYVKEVRDDGKVDVLLDPPGYDESIEKNTDLLLSALKENEGFLDLNDKSTPSEISQRLGMSKKAFKKALGKLYKQKLVVITEKGMKLSK